MPPSTVPPFTPVLNAGVMSRSGVEGYPFRPSHIVDSIADLVALV